MLASSFLMCATMAALAADGLTESSSSSEEDPPGFRRLLPVAEVVLYMLSFGFGVGNVPWILLGKDKTLNTYCESY